MNIEEGNSSEKKKYVSVIFTSHTESSELAKRWRSKLKTFEKVSSMRLKVVERTGTKLTDLLHKSNAWEDNYCSRDNCLICDSTSNDERKGLCKKKNVVYKNYCISCNKKEKY